MEQTTGGKEKHEEAVMIRREPFLANTYYVGKGHKAPFDCPVCGRTTMQHLNFLGRRAVFCSGERIRKG
jgi:hypothetical protein